MLRHGLLAANSPSRPNFLTVNFHDIFGTSGCLTHCAERQALQRGQTETAQNPELSRAQRRQNVISAKKTFNAFRSKSFSRAELAASIAAGCGSCGVLGEILGQVLPAELPGHQYVYGVSDRFLITRQQSAPPGGTASSIVTLEIPLFQADGLYVYWEGMPRNTFLTGDTGSVQTLDRLAGWLQECDTNHNKLCTVTRPHRLPTRLIDTTEIFSPTGQSGVRLVETQAGQTDRYLCLSHCWGGEIPCKTRTATLRDYLRFIDYASLAKNFQDAILVTRRLGARYIWIDSICIIQDDAADKDRECAKMDEVYRNAYLTIAAASAPNSEGGCFSQIEADKRIVIDPPSQSQSQSQSSSLPSGPYIVGARMSEVGSISTRAMLNRYPLFGRGWVFQERLLSPRFVSFNYGEVSFQCREGDRCECEKGSLPPHARTPPDPKGFRVSDIPTLRALLATADSPPNAAPASPLDLQHVRDQWRYMAVQYTKLGLSEPTDMLPAISGCASVLQHCFPGDTYVAGMWASGLARDLLWSTVSSESLSAREGRPWTAPSWSWASVPPGQAIEYGDSGIARPYTRATNLLVPPALLQVNCTPENSQMAPLGKLACGSLFIKARVLPCHVRRFCGYTATRAGRYRTFELYESPRSRDPDFKPGCVPAVSGLDVHGGTIHFLPDQPPARAFAWAPLPTCPGPLGCALGQIWLLRTEQKAGKEMVKDSFMMLRKADPTMTLPAGTQTSGEVFERVGVMVLVNHTEVERETWFETVWDRDALPEQVFTIV